MVEDSKIIFTTAYSQYALDAFDLAVVDYLLKPVSFERFLISVEKIEKRIQTIDVPAIQETKHDYIFVKSGYRMLKINLEDIQYFEALSDYVAIHTKESKILTLETMTFFENSLSKIHFARIHRSYIISLSKIEFIERNQVMINKKSLPISKTYQSTLWEQLGKK